jgi:hypothetical protein
VIELFNAWWEAHADTPVKASELAPAVKEIADPSQHGRQYLARAIGNLAGTRQGGFLLERFGDLPNNRKEGARYRLLQILPTVDPHKSSASSASSIVHEKSAANSAGCSGKNAADDLRMTADDSADGRGIRAASAQGATPDSAYEINYLTGTAADNADDADDFGQSNVSATDVDIPFPGAGGGMLSDYQAALEELALRKREEREAPRSLTANSSTH